MSVPTTNAPEGGMICTNNDVSNDLDGHHFGVLAGLTREWLSQQPSNVCAKCGWSLGQQCFDRCAVAFDVEHSPNSGSSTCGLDQIGRPRGLSIATGSRLQK